MSGDQTVLEFLDDDLRRKLDNFRGAPGFDTLRGIVLAEQQKRLELRAMTPVARRRIDTRDRIEKAIRDKSEVQEHIAYFHTVLALCGFPYSRPADGVVAYEQAYGRNSLVVEAGKVLDPRSGRMIVPGLPFGPKARLLMLHICTRALRENSPEIDVGDSMSAFMREVGFKPSGGERGTIGAFKEQMNRLAGANMTIGLFRGEEAITVRTQPIKEISVWLDGPGNQRCLWKNEVRLEIEFFETLKRHAFPIDLRALRAFSQSARQIDMVVWLDYRVKRMKTRYYTITWELLKEQFGGELKRMDHFQERFRKELAKIEEVFPKLPAKLTESGLRLEQRPEGLFEIPPRQAITRTGK